jgi:Tfp pilus assembly protein PilO
MSEQHHVAQQQPRVQILRDQVRSHIERLRASRQRSALGLAEIAGLAGAAVLVVAVLFAYFSMLVPARTRLSRAKTKQQELQAQIKEATGGVKVSTNKQEAVRQISQSLQDFESNVLTARDSGRLELYTELNDLIHTNNLRNTSGPNYMSLDALDASGKLAVQGTKSGNAKWQSMYPGIGVAVTVEGQYANLRHFIRDIEANDHFLVINAVQLETATNTDTPKPVAGAAVEMPSQAQLPAQTQQVQPKSGLVSLQLDMATYFRREGNATGDASPSSMPR